jgi:uncharacterized membrane protein YczE
VLFGVSIAMMVRARLGLDSWDVLHQGLARQTGLRFGWIVIGVGAVVLLLWIPLRQRPGFGTVSNVIMVGLSVDAALAVLPHPRQLSMRTMFLLGGILGNGIATGLYIGAGLGPGPRDGLMTGLASKGMSIRLARTMIELTVLATGWLLGGNVGAGTVLYAISIGPLAHYFIPRLSTAPPGPGRAQDLPAPPGAPMHGGTTVHANARDYPVRAGLYIPSQRHRRNTVSHGKPGRIAVMVIHSSHRLERAPRRTALVRHRQPARRRDPQSREFSSYEADLR